MDFALTEEQEMIAQTARDFFDENATSDRTRAAMQGNGIDPELWQSFAGELGLAGLVIAEEHGGSQLGMVELASVAEAAGANVAALPLLGNAMAACALTAGGSQEQKSEFLPQLASGELIASVGFATAGAVRFAGGKVDGVVKNVPHGGAAGLLVVFDGGNGWVLRADDAGVRSETPVTMDQTRPLARIRFDGASATPLENAGSALAAALEAGLVCLSAEALGGAQACLDRTVAYSKDRVQFGRPIGSFQAYKHRLADMMVGIEQSRSAVYWAACCVDENAAETPLALHGAKSFVADTYFKCAGDMIQLHGGIGFTWEHDAHLFFKRAKTIQNLLGTSDWHREQVAAMVLDGTQTGEAA
ncbi:acyl-CoA dehydrogenase family protein [Croceicoccus sp. F390]|uniref:Acyl-CoA dehydrogenase family protein n=1 Tax=Croceicoccus esteveae TaxID=3075597 RepID=A0ABU2ZGG5_9SPHN|nr:acyl-CoA dehydrogenase family protein [Croceicoccus sp. F390]MDT0575178.1 acyl-CoA dehydrogenase family protein [Croceicoccus sp. F390]